MLCPPEKKRVDDGICAIIDSEFDDMDALTEADLAEIERLKATDGTEN